MTRKSIFCIGEAMVEFRRADDQFWLQGFAGDALNVGWALRALLPQDDVAIRFLSRVGTDSFSNNFLEFLTDSGIQTDLLSRDAERTIGLYSIETDKTGERSFSYWRGQSAARHLAAKPDQLRDALANAHMVYTSGITLAILLPEHRTGFLDVLRDLKQAGTLIAFDPNIRPRLWEDPDIMRRTIEMAASLANIVLPTFEDEALSFGDADPWETIARYKNLGVQEIVVKDGVRSTCYMLEGDKGKVDVQQAVEAVDTTGAGDSFNGAYLSCRLAGRDVLTAILNGQAVSKAVVGEKGALIDMSTIRNSSQCSTWKAHCGGDLEF
jgi:2-dehydro-3-deoxygluconokinase